MIATSEPLSKPSGTVRTIPWRPARAIASMFGVFAASIGVLPPSSLSGSSAAPSGMMIAYFTAINLTGGSPASKFEGLARDAELPRIFAGVVGVEGCEGFEDQVEMPARVGLFAADLGEREEAL